MPGTAPSKEEAPQRLKDKMRHREDLYGYTESAADLNRASVDLPTAHRLGKAGLLSN
jgi:hypothetical protein